MTRNYKRDRRGRFARVNSRAGAGRRVGRGSAGGAAAGAAIGAAVKGAALYSTPSILAAAAGSPATLGLKGAAYGARVGGLQGAAIGAGIGTGVGLVYVGGRAVRRRARRPA